VSCLQLLLTVWVGRVTINILPDDVLLRIFHFDRVTHTLGGGHLLSRLFWRWDRLAHVCRRWRSVVFASPNFLDLRLVYGPSTHMELTGIWPPLPIIISNILVLDKPLPKDYDFDAAVVQHDRVCEIDLHSLTNLQLQ